MPCNLHGGDVFSVSFSVFVHSIQILFRFCNRSRVSNLWGLINKIKIYMKYNSSPYIGTKYCLWLGYQFQNFEQQSVQTDLERIRFLGKIKIFIEVKNLLRASPNFLIVTLPCYNCRYLHSTPATPPYLYHFVSVLLSSYLADEQCHWPW